MDRLMGIGDGVVDDDARAKRRSVSPKTTAEEEDVQDTKVPKNKKKNRRR